MHYRMLLLQNSLRYTYVEDRFLNTNNTLSPIPRPKHAFGGAENWNVWLKRRIVLRPTGIVPKLALPHGIIHMDWNSTNILWHEDGSLSCVLDFEFATWGPLVFDVAFLVLEFCSEADDLRNHRRDKTTEQQTVSCNATKGSSSESALVNAYSKVRSMTVQELALLRPSIALLGLRSIPWLLENNFHDYLRAFTAKLEKFLWRSNSFDPVWVVKLLLYEYCVSVA